MLVRLFKLAAVFALMVSLGLHWAFLQSFAWVGMVTVNSRQFSFREAVQRTFDGQHPCSLCTAIEQGRKAENDTANQLTVRKLECIQVGIGFVFRSPHDFWVQAETISPLRSRVITPPAPPPKFNLA